jgi:hypothetical protein
MTDNGTAVWASRTHLPSAPDGSARFLVATHADSRHADGDVVDTPTDQDPDQDPAQDPAQDPSSGMLAWCTVVAGHVRVDRILPGPLGRQLFGAAPPLRYVVIGEPAASPPAVTLIAFHDPERDGLVTGPEQAGADGLELLHRAAAIRWLPGSGVAHQIYVSGPDDPAGDWRRRKVGLKLGSAAEALRVAHGWPPLHDSGQHTQTGRAMAASFAPRWPARFTKPEVIVPSMDLPRAEQQDGEL